MILVLILALSNFRQPFVIEIDASRYGLEVVLMQQQQSIAYFNQVLSQHA